MISLIFLVGSTKKIRLIIYYNKFKTSNLIISNNSFSSTKLLDMTNMYICSNVPWETVFPKKIIHMLVLPLQLFQDVLLCTLMILAS